MDGRRACILSRVCRHACAGDMFGRRKRYAHTRVSNSAGDTIEEEEWYGENIEVMFLTYGGCANSYMQDMCHVTEQRLTRYVDKLPVPSSICVFPYYPRILILVSPRRCLGVVYAALGAAHVHPVPVSVCCPGRIPGALALLRGQQGECCTR